MFRRLTRARRTRGLTLLELVVAVLVLSLGSLAAIRATDQSRHAIGGLPSRVLAGIVARNRVQEVRIYGATSIGSLPSTVEMGGRNFEITEDSETTASGLVQVSVTARGPDGAGARLVAFLPRKGMQP